MSITLSRSPYIIEIDETGQTGSKIELFLWTTGSQPASPQYTLSKKIPASNNIKTYYNISPYVKEYYSFTNWANGGTEPYNSYDLDISTNYIVNYTLKQYKEVSGTYTLLSTTTSQFMDGYNYYMEGFDTINNTVLLSEGRYFYNYDSGVGTSLPQTMAGSFDVHLAATDVIRYTNLVTGVVNNFTATTAGVKTFSRVYLPNLSQGNKVEYLAGGSAVRWTGYFEPQCEPKYTPVAVDFINRYGSWARIFFQKAKTRNISVQADNYKVNPSALPYVPTSEGQVKEFNKNGKETIKLNTGWVNDLYGEYIEELLLSEKVMLYDPEKLYNNTAKYTPVNVQSKSLLKQKGINKKVINYELTFEFAFDLINNVV
tara:strand:- start:1944 stop:3056 length:1113 start_codon:yes stop_codon:yes gene_type:complete